MSKFGTWIVLLPALALPLLAQTVTYELPQAGCVHITNCIVYGPAESFSLWEETGTAGQSWQIFNVYSWVGGFPAVDTYHCDSAAWQQGPAGSGAPAGSNTQITASCAGVDTNGTPFTMNFVLYAYSYYSRGGGGKGGGGAGTPLVGNGRFRYDRRMIRSRRQIKPVTQLVTGKAGEPGATASRFFLRSEVVE